VPAVVVVGWRFRDRVAAAVFRVLAPLARRLPRLTVAGLRERIHDLGTAFDRIASHPRALVYALLFAYVGWVFFALPLYFAGLTLEVAITPLLVLFIVPASTLAGLVPSPGGLAGVEFALTGLLIALVGLGQAEAFSVALVYRLASYWFAIVVGGVAALWVIRRA
jgi:uncharacterized protein (TIRG00374 family)